jgi:hypothetical protein
MMPLNCRADIEVNDANMFRVHNGSGTQATGNVCGLIL